MLWRKHWRDVRWIALVGALGLFAFGCDLLDKVGTLQRQFAYGDAGPNGLPIASYQLRPISFWNAARAYVMAALPMTLVLVAILLGIGGLGYERSAGTSVFTLSLPYTRRRLVISRFAVGAAIVLALGVGAMLGASVWAAIRGVGDEFPFLRAIAAGLCVTAVALTIYAFAFLAANVTAHAVRSIATVVTVAIALAFVLASHNREIPQRWTIAWLLRPLDFVELASGNDIVRAGNMPWLGVMIALIITVGLLVATVRWVERYDF